jgi:surface protein
LPSEIIEMTVDNIKVKPSTSYIFRKIGYHTVYFLFDLSKTKSLRYMFFSIDKLSGISFTPLFNSENITDIDSMFYYCKSLLYIDLHNFNTINVENMNQTFRYMSSLVSIDLSLLNTQNVRYMFALLSNNPSLKYVNFSNINT